MNDQPAPPPSIHPAPIEWIDVAAIRIPTDEPEADGTLTWAATTAVIVAVTAGGQTGLGYTYSSRAAAVVIEDVLRERLIGRPAWQVRAHWMTMRRAVRNLGEPGIAATAISAVDIALWDLLARSARLPLCRLLGGCREAAPAYGSGGFSSYSDQRLRSQLEGFLALGLEACKIKIGRDDARDAARVAFARDVVGPDASLYVDANGAYTVPAALTMAAKLAEHGVSWFEEPVSADDTAGLARVRDFGPAAMRVAAGEYGYRSDDFRRLLEASAVDVLMIDATRAGGVTGFLEAASLAAAFHVPVSTHCAPTLHRHLACALPSVSSVEYFHDHARIEPMLFDGAAEIRNGRIVVDTGRPGLGIELAADDLVLLAQKLHEPDDAERTRREAHAGR